MTRYLTVAAAAALVGLTAAPLGAGTPGPAPAEPVVVATAPTPAPNWSGPYMGLHLGYGAFTPNFSTSAEDSSLLYGLHIGIMHDFGPLVLGAEVDVDLVRDQIFAITSMARLKGRIGISAGNLLPYLTAGVVRANSDGFGSDTGWVAGGGVAVRLGDRWMWSAEALHHRFGGFDINGTIFSLRTSYRF